MPVVRICRNIQFSNVHEYNIVIWILLNDKKTYVCRKKKKEFYFRWISINSENAVVDTLIRRQVE